MAIIEHNSRLNTEPVDVLEDVRAGRCKQVILQIPAGGPEAVGAWVDMEETIFFLTPFHEKGREEIRNAIIAASMAHFEAFAQDRDSGRPLLVALAAHPGKVYALGDAEAIAAMHSAQAIGHWFLTLVGSWPSWAHVRLDEVMINGTPPRAQPSGEPSGKTLRRRARQATRARRA